MAKKKRHVSLPFEIWPDVWAEIITWLIRLGWLAWSKQVKITTDSVPKLAEVHWDAILRAVGKYQYWAGLKDDHYPGPVTQHHLFQPRICGTPDAMGLDQTCKWPHTNITYSVLNTLPGVSDADFKAAAEWAMNRWDAVCGLKSEYKATLRTANVILTVADLGGPGGVLADSMLPCGASPTDTMQQRYDSREVWYAGLGTPTQGRISLPAVIAHELGHAIGIPHLDPNGPVGLMQPFYRPNVLDLQQPDVAQAVERYGVNEPTPPPVPPVPPTPPAMRYRLKGTNMIIDPAALEPIAAWRERFEPWLDTSQWESS